MPGAFDALFGIEDAGFRPKPERAAFTPCSPARRGGPEAAAMFEDDPRNLAVPHALGMACVLVNPTPQPAPHVHHQITDLASFLAPLGRPGHEPRARRHLHRRRRPGRADRRRGAGRRGLRACWSPIPGRRRLRAPGAAPGDLRSTAFLRPAQALFARLGLWQRLAPLATPLEALRIVDLAGDPPAPRTERLWGEPGGGPLGWNFMNEALRPALAAHVAAMANVEIAWGTGFARLVNRSTEALLTLTDGRNLSARLALAADGRASPLREAAGIGVKITRYGQKALAFAIRHDRPHQGISTEFYLDGGPFTVVPLPDHKGSPASAVVWMNPGPRAVDARRACRRRLRPTPQPGARPGFWARWRRSPRARSGR